MSADSTVRTIKRYTNRKLYDTAGSCYVTLEDIAAMIREGTEVQVFDNRTKEDLTHMTLAQIIFESQRDKTQLSSLSSLRGLIQSLPDEQPGGKDTPTGEDRAENHAESHNIAELLSRIERLERQVMELARVIQRLPIGVVKSASRDAGR